MPIFWRYCGAAALSMFWLLRRSFILREYAYILASLRGSSLVYILAATEELYLQRICLYSGVAAGQQLLSIFWLLRRSCIFREFAHILASLRGSDLCPYSGCYGGAPIIEEANFADILGIARERFKRVFLLRPRF